jgi:signal transduction histidine kinase
MSHELRTPMNAILGFTEMILDEVYGEVPEDVKERVKDIQTCGRQLLRLINDVLDLSKIEAGRMELSPADYLVPDIVATVRTSLASLAAEKGMEFVATAEDDLPVAFGDGKRITQCLINLAGNAIKFTRQGRVEIRVERQGETLLYRVSDTGIGIPRDQIDHIFSEFRQADPTIAKEFGGTGLGLSITRKFVELHGGRIWVESEPGRGSTFFFTVPLRLAKGAAA